MQHGAAADSGPGRNIVRGGVVVAMLIEALNRGLQNGCAGELAFGLLPGLATLFRGELVGVASRFSCSFSGQWRILLHRLIRLTILEVM